MRKAIFLFLLAVPAISQTLGKNDRPVFRSARKVADDCQEYLKLYPDEQSLTSDGYVSTTMGQIASTASCTAYLDGAQDGGLEGAFTDKYHPVAAHIESRGTLIRTFVKYVNDHPEQQDFAASTIIRKAMHLIVDAQKQSK